MNDVNFRNLRRSQPLQRAPLATPKKSTLLFNSYRNAAASASRPRPSKTPFHPRVDTWTSKTTAGASIATPPRDLRRTKFPPLRRVRFRERLAGDICSRSRTRTPTPRRRPPRALPRSSSAAVHQQHVHERSYARDDPPERGSRPSYHRTAARASRNTNKNPIAENVSAYAPSNAPWSARAADVAARSCITVHSDRHGVDDGERRGERAHTRAGRWMSRTRMRRKFDESYSGCARAPAWSAARRARGVVRVAHRRAEPASTPPSARESTRSRRRGVTNSRARHS